LYAIHFSKEKRGCYKKLVIAGQKAEIPTEIVKNAKNIYGKFVKKVGGPGKLKPFGKSLIVREIGGNPILLYF
jgi:hypothetical protein